MTDQDYEPVEYRPAFNIASRQGGKTAAMFDELVRVAREYEEADEANKLHLVCHEDEEPAIRRALDAALARIWAPRRVELHASPYAPRGSVLAFPQSSLEASGLVTSPAKPVTQDPDIP